MSSCPPAQLCPVEVVLAMVQPVRSRSSAVLAASRDPASRRLSDRPEKTAAPSHIYFLSPPLHLSQACQASCCTPHLLFSSSVTVVALAEQVIVCFVTRRNISKGKLEFCCLIFIYFIIFFIIIIVFFLFFFLKSLNLDSTWCQTGSFSS